MASMIVHAVVLGCLIALVQNAPSEAPTAASVRVKLLDFSYTGDCDPFGISRCDLLFNVDYQWNGKSVSQKYGEYDGGSDSAHLDFGKEEPRVLDGPFPVGSKVVVNVVAKDVDVFSDDTLGRFRFEYTLPSVPQTTDAVLAVQDGKAHMSIKFLPNY